MRSEAEISAGAEPESYPNLLEEVGWRGLVVVVWRATPFPLRLISLPYGVAVYRALLATSDSLACLHALHGDKYTSSLWFRLLRPRYRRVRPLLESLGLCREVRPWPDRCNVGGSDVVCAVGEDESARAHYRSCPVGVTRSSPHLSAAAPVQARRVAVVLGAQRRYAKPQPMPTRKNSRATAPMSS